VELRPLRTVGTGLLAGALVLTVTEVAVRTPAHADDPVVLIESPPVWNAPAHPPLTVVQDVGTGTVTVTNPGGTAPTTQQCVEGVTDLSFCLGTSDQLVYPEDINLGPITITGAPTQAGTLPGSDLDWIIDDAVTSVAQLHGVRADDLVRTYARAQIRAHVAMRIDDILNKKLYGVAMSPLENRAYAALEALYKARLVNKAKQALREYEAWTAAPCAYRVPDPPDGSGQPYVPNEIVSTQVCAGLNQNTQAFKVLNYTPPVEAFDSWASYRHPSPLTRHGADPNVVRMLANTDDSYVTLSTLGFALATAGAAAATIISLNLSLVAVWIADASYHAFLWWFTAGGFLAIAAAVIIAALVAGVVIWKIVEDAKPGVEIRRRVTEASGLTDPFGIEARQADYAGLDYSTGEDPVGQPPAMIHDPSFLQDLMSNTYEWMMFDGEGRGDLIVDPTVGWNSNGATTAADLKFTDENDVVYDPLVVLAPEGTRDPNGREISGYRVKVARGWLLVATFYKGAAGYTAYQPRLNVRYDAGDDRKGMMSLWRNAVPGEPEKTEFLHTVVEPDGTVGDRFTSDSWTLQSIGDVTRTVQLKPSEPVLPDVSVVPSVQGNMVAGNLVELQANLSEPAQGGGGTYTWEIQRLGEEGEVVQTIAPPAGNLSGFQIRLNQPGRYRVMVDYADAVPVPLQASGRIEFTVVPPQPEVLAASVRDDRVLDGSLSLDLRMLQDTPSDTFDVTVEWADDALGNRAVEHYTVECANAGPGNCDTGPLLTPMQAPVNENWSESPTYRIADDQNYLPQVIVTVTNGYGNEITRVFPITGDHRPRYETLTPQAVMPAGTLTTVDVVEVFPSPLLTESQDLTILPYVEAITDQLPEGIQPDVEERNGRWFLQLTGTPQADAIGEYTFYFPFEQEPLGMALRPPPALATLEIKAADAPGYRSVLLGTTTPFLERQYRNEYPDYDVQVTQVLEEGEEDFTDFGGVVMCRLTAGPDVLFDKECEADKPFPWPKRKISDTMVASTYVESDTQPISADGPYEVGLTTKFLLPQVSKVGENARRARFEMVLRDGLNTPILTPYSAHGYTVRCSRDGSAFKPCLDEAKLSLPRVPGRHRLDVRVKAPDGAVTTVREKWRVTTPETEFEVAVPDQPRQRGAKVVVRAAGLLPRETYVVRIDGAKVATGKASLAGKVRVRVTIPRGADPGKAAVTVRGAKADRQGADTLRILP